MRRIVLAEGARLLRTRGIWGIVAAMVAVVALGILQTAVGAETARPLWERQGFLLAVVNSQVFLMVLGAKATTDDVRFGTLVSQSLIVPKRSRIVAGKLLMLGAAGLGASLLVASTVLVASIGHLPDGLDTDSLVALGGLAATGAMFVPLGGAIGYLARHQTGAILGVIVGSLVIGQLVGGRLGDWSMVLPTDAGASLAIAATSVSMLGGGLILAAWAIGGGMVAAVITQRRDVI